MNMAHAASMLFLLAACAAQAVLGAAPIWPYQQCGGLGGSFMEYGKDEAVFECMEGAKCKRESEFWWGCVPDEDSEDVAIAHDCKTVLAIAMERGDLTMFVDVVNATGFLPFMNNLHGIKTVFAPTDDAFERASASLGEADLVTIAKVMQYHIAPATTIKSDDVEDGQLISTLKEGSMFKVDLSGEGVHLEAETGGKARIAEADIVACRALLHVVDAVLLPDGM